jgi:CRISPR-associated endonuclease/helicase Cas3
MNYEDFFRQAMGLGSQDRVLSYQIKLAVEECCPRLLDVPTGLGKTAAAILSWVWRRRFDPKARPKTPRRLVYCLPMRVLVEQTYAETIRWLERLGLLAGSSRWTVSDSDSLPTKDAHLIEYKPDPEAQLIDGWAAKNGDLGNHPISVYLLLGGEEVTDWVLWPGSDAVFIGTQDMLISRALNRGYASARARWPFEFGLLNSDCLWVFDEVQLMDTSLATSLQLDAWRHALQLRSKRSEFTEQKEHHLPLPCHSLWMSATMAKHWLEKAIDWSPHVESAWTPPQRLYLSDDEKTNPRLRSGQLFEIKKDLKPLDGIKLDKPKMHEGRADKTDAERKQEEYLEKLAKHLSEPQNRAGQGLTLVVLNTVERAAKLFKLLHSRERSNNLENVLGERNFKLIHSRFRPYERKRWREFFGRRDAEPRLLIATQVVEAGVDLSAAVLYTELAPWAALVQRFGRCARYPEESGTIYWLDIDLGTDRQQVDHWAKPYERNELIGARKRLDGLKDAGLKSLSEIKDAIDQAPNQEEVRGLFPYEPRFVPRDKDLFDLFDTTPDLTGADVDVSRFIRDGEDLDVQVFWRDLPNGNDPDRKDRPQRDELCAVAFYRFREFADKALSEEHRIWRRRYATGRTKQTVWEKLERGQIDQVVYPGQTFLLEKACGGYSPTLGWTGDLKDVDFDLPGLLQPTLRQSTAADDEEDADDLAELNKWVALRDHCHDVHTMLVEILESVSPNELTESQKKVLQLAARLHDWGKAHPAFVAKLDAQQLGNAPLGGQPAAKAPAVAWRRDPVRKPSSDVTEDQEDRRRPGFRHELASALAIVETLYAVHPGHQAFAWPEGLDKSEFREDASSASPQSSTSVNHPLACEIDDLNEDEFDLLIYLVAAHHGKVRMSLRSSPDDERTDVPDVCPADKRQARGVRDNDELPACELPNNEGAAISVPKVTLSLDPMELGLSARYGASWRERTQSLLERLGPFRLAYLEALLRAADWRASIEEDRRAMNQGGGSK